MGKTGGWFSRLTHSPISTQATGASTTGRPSHPSSLAETLFRQARELRQARANDEAVELYERALKLDPQRIDGWINLGIILHEIRRPKAALECFRTAQRIPTSSGNFEAILSQLVPPCERAVARATGDEEAEIWLRKGWKAYEAREWATALALYERARHLNPRHPHVLVQMGMTLYEMHREPEAMALFDQAWRIHDPEITELLAGLFPSRYHG
jgi:tetratricopeptide (TPR) repeat protein